MSTSVIPSKNANSVHVMKMCSALARKGNDVTLIGSKGDYVEDIFKYYNVKENFKISLSDMGIMSSIRRLIKSIKESKNIDLIVTRWPIAALYFSVFSSKKIILEYHSYPNSGLNELILKLCLIQKNITKYVFITNSLREYFYNKNKKLIKKRTVVLPDGADIINNVYIKDIIGVDKVKCCYVGSFNKGKGIDSVIKIANELPNIQFEIVGGNDEEIEKMKAMQLNNNINWYGFLKQKAAMEVIRDSQIALLPNEPKVYIGGNKDIGQWTSPMKLFEYMSNGKAIISSNLDVLKEILTNNYNCILVEYNNINQWKNAINYLINNEEIYKRISENAKKDLDGKYSWDIRANKILDI